jgi:hypothetical protein
MKVSRKDRREAGKKEKDARFWPPDNKPPRSPICVS